MHVERRDLLPQLAGHAVCSLYWFHPLAWLAARQLRKERERACDDAVLLHGIPAHDYAAHLVDLVRAMAAGKAEWAGALGMAERSDLESRVRALLDRRRARHPLTRRAAFAVSAAMLAVLLPLCVLTMYGQASSAGLTGVVRDPSGAVIPKSRATLRNLDGPNQESTEADMAGRYQFAAIPPGHYELAVSGTGFATVRLPVVLTAGVVATVNVGMNLGTVRQSVEVAAQKPVTLAPRTQQPRERIRVGGMVQQAKLLAQTPPVYPPDAKAEGVEGIVKINAVISRNGDLLSPVVVSTIDPRLAKAALDSIASWRYSPALLNGEPVEVPTSIDVAFKLNQ
jgi:TonB family protein